MSPDRLLRKLKAAMNPSEQLGEVKSSGLNKVHYLDRMTGKKEEGFQLRLEVEDTHHEILTNYGRARVVQLSADTLQALHKAFTESLEKTPEPKIVGVVVENYRITLMCLNKQNPKAGSFDRFGGDFDVVYGEETWIHSQVIGQINAKEIVALSTEVVANKEVLQETARQTWSLLSE